MQTRSACGNVLQRRNGALPADPARLNASLAKKAGTLSFPSQSAAASLQLLCRRRELRLNVAIQKDLTRWPRKGKTLKIEAAAADAVPQTHRISPGFWQTGLQSCYPPATDRDCAGGREPLHAVPEAFSHPAPRCSASDSRLNVWGAG